jgi:hypothetical protein
MRLLVTALATALLAVALVPMAAGGRASVSSRAPRVAERRQIDAAIHSWWCSYLPSNDGPCSRWTLETNLARLSTVVPSWGYARFTDQATGGSTDLPGQISVILRRGPSGWHVFRWFIGIRALTCAQGAHEVGIPLRVMQDLGMCKLLSTLP